MKKFDCDGRLSEVYVMHVLGREMVMEVLVNMRKYYIETAKKTDTTITYSFEDGVFQYRDKSKCVYCELKECGKKTMEHGNSEKAKTTKLFQDDTLGLLVCNKHSGLHWFFKNNRKVGFERTYKNGVKCHVYADYLKMTFTHTFQNVEDLRNVEDIIIDDMVYAKLSQLCREIPHIWFCDTRICFNCARDASIMKKCSRCKIAYYCSKSCQLSHYPCHKMNCKKCI